MGDDNTEKLYLNNLNARLAFEAVELRSEGLTLSELANRVIEAIDHNVPITEIRAAFLPYSTLEKQPRASESTIPIKKQVDARSYPLPEFYSDGKAGIYVEGMDHPESH